MDLLIRETLVAFAILLFVLIYPCPLWDPPVPPALPRAVGEGHRPVTLPAKGELALKGVGLFNREAFLHHFEAQAGERLMPCLRQLLGEKGSVTFMARLARNGKISAVRLLEARQTNCATEAVEAMEFASVTASLRVDSVEIGWRFDW